MTVGTIRDENGQVALLHRKRSLFFTASPGTRPAIFAGPWYESARTPVRELTSNSLLTTICPRANASSLKRLPPAELMAQSLCALAAGVLPCHTRERTQSRIQVALVTDGGTGRGDRDASAHSSGPAGEWPVSWPPAPPQFHRACARRSKTGTGKRAPVTSRRPSRWPGSRYERDGCKMAGQRWASGAGPGQGWADVSAQVAISNARPASCRRRRLWNWRAPDIRRLRAHAAQGLQAAGESESREAPG
ncbi:hypothetical protein OBBRIDRAFT_632650 [Obba rivulosa]|uniref:Uncharacterized protein n=1 Tax=Obba rivulosa TaxID=1052685 RepID=A0A8E2DLL8_9APHY|nr:hypothetical protein OBBRIDRAFT_632650 [Obba rivulosa]